jgi:hypothetical protein
MLTILHVLALCAFSLASSCAVAGDIFARTEEGVSTVLSNVPQGEGFKLLLAGPREEPIPVKSSVVSVPGVTMQASMLERARSYGPWVDEAARISKIDARLLHAVIATESAYNPHALSNKGAVGMMQLMPATARRYGVTDSRDARQNIGAGARYLADLLRLFHNDTSLALAAYNAGENAVLRYGSKVPPYAETLAYVPRVLGFYNGLASASL